MMFLEYLKKKRELKEIIRLEKLILEEANHAIIRDIRTQIHLCESLTWRDYNFFKKY